MNASQIEHLKRQIAELNVRNAALATRTAGTHQIYNSACIVGNTTDMDNLREQLHAMLDEQLDQNASLFMLVRQLTSLSGYEGH